MIDDSKILESVKLYTNLVNGLSNDVKKNSNEYEYEYGEDRNLILNILTKGMIILIPIVICIILYLLKPSFIMEVKKVEGTFFSETKLSYLYLLLSTCVISLIMFIFYFAYISKVTHEKIK